MQKSIELQLEKWLDLLDIKISSAYLSDKIQKHPDYPSLLSITDTLNSLGIENSALVVDKERVKEIPSPFLAHLKSKDNDFMLVESVSDFVNSKSSAFKKWDGVIVLADKPENFQNQENQEWLLKEEKEKYKNTSIIVGIVAFSMIALALQFSWVGLGLLLSIEAGLFVAILIVQHELGYNNDLTKQLCSVNKSMDCDSVLISKGSTLIKGFKWSDAGIIYFSSLLFLFLNFSFSNNTSSFYTLIAMLSIASIPFSFYSLYYQWSKVKKWCPLCLVTVGLLWLQFILLLPHTLLLSNILIDLNLLAVSVFVLALVSTLWLYIINPLLQSKRELKKKIILLARLKNNVAVFNSLLKQQKKVNIAPFAHDIQIGNPHSPVQIMVACATHCGPCAEAHKILKETLAENNVGCTIRFCADLAYKEDVRMQTLEYILKLIVNSSPAQKGNILHNWYSLMDFEKFKSFYPLPLEADVLNQLEDHEQWTNKSEIKFTPTLFINGYEWPKQYSRMDMPEIVKQLIENLSSPEINKVEKQIENSPEAKLFIAQ